MLIGIPPLLGPDLLAALRAMGHGDEVALVDGNYPALTDARRLVRADGIGLIAMAEAILTVMPVDDFVPQAIFRACKGDDPDTLEPVHSDIIALCARLAPGHAVAPLPGAMLYERIKAAHLIVATSEPRLFGNMIVRKGVIRPT
jgi:L-fucose mutarotase